MPNRYRTIVADPPWPYPSPAGNLRASAAARPQSWDTKSVAGSEARYGAMSMEAVLTALVTLALLLLAHPDAQSEAR